MNTYIRDRMLVPVLKIIWFGYFISLLILASEVPVSAQAEEDVTFNIQGTDGPCPTSLEGYWVKNGDLVDAMEVSNQGVNLLYREAVIVRVPLFSELPRTAPCAYPVTLRVLRAESGRLREAIRNKQRITLVMTVRGLK